MTGVSSPADLLTVVPVSASAGPPLVSAAINASSLSVDQVQQVVKQTGVKTTNTVGGSMCDEKTVEYLRDLIEEKKTIENNNTKDENAPKSIVLRLLDQGKQTVYEFSGGESSFEWLINSLRTEVMSYKYVKVEDAEVLPSGIKQ